MIQLIGIMIGFYIIVRFVEIHQTRETKSLKALTVIGIIITIFLMLGMLASGVTPPKY